MIDKLSGDYNKGFTKGIQKVLNGFDGFCSDLKYNNKRLTEKNVKDYLKCCLANRELLRDFDDSFIRWNHIKNKCELWREKWSKYENYKGENNE